MNTVNFNPQKPYIYNKYIRLESEIETVINVIISPLTHSLTTSHLNEVLFSIENRYNPSRESILFIHGFGGTSLNWLSLIKNLDDKFNCIAIDLPGSGFSSREFEYQKKFKTCQTILDYYEERIMNFIRKRRLKEPILCCHSFGGYIGSYVLKKNPTFFKKAILLSPLSGDQSFVSENIIETSIQVLMYLFNIYPQKSYCNKKIQSIFLRKCMIKENVNEWHQYLHEIGKCNQENSSEENFFFLFSQVTNEEYNIPLFLEKVKIDIKCLYGDLDWMPYETIKYLSLKNPNVKITVIPGIDHQVQMSDLIFNFF